MINLLVRHTVWFERIQMPFYSFHKDAVRPPQSFSFCINSHLINTCSRGVLVETAVVYPDKSCFRRRLRGSKPSLYVHLLKFHKHTAWKRSESRYNCHFTLSIRMWLDRLLSDSRVNNRRLKDAVTARVYQVRIYAKCKWHFHFA